MPAARKPYTEGEYLKLEAYVFENPDQRIGGPKFWNRLLAVCIAHEPGHNADYFTQDCPWARVHSAGSWQSHWSGNGMLQQRMHRAQQKGRQEQQCSDEEDSTPAPAPIRPHSPVAGSSNSASPLQDTRLGKRKVREVEPVDSLPLRKRPRTHQDTHTSSKFPVRPNGERGRADLAVSRPSNQPLTHPIARAPAQPVQTVTHDLALSFSPPKCSTPAPLHQIPLPVPTCALRSPVVPLLPPLVIRQSPAKPTNDRSEPEFRTRRQPKTSSLRPQTRNRVEFINIDLRLKFSDSEEEDGQSEQGAREEKNPVVSGSRKNESQSANEDEDSDKTEPDTDADQDGGETNDDSQFNDSEVWMETQDYAMPWRKCLPAIPSPPSIEHSTVPVQGGNKDQILVPGSQSTNSQSTGNPKLRPSQRVDPGTRSIDGRSPQKEREMDSDTSCVPDSQDNISLLGPSSRLDCILSSSLPSSVPESCLPHLDEQPKPEDKPLSQPSQPSQLTDPDFVPGNASFDEYTDPLEFPIGVGSQPEAPLELKDEVDRLGRVVHYEDAGYALRDRERLRRSESGASTGTDTATLVGDYFEGKQEEIKKETEDLQESQLTQTDGSQCQPSQPLSSESQGSQPLTASAPIRSGSSKSACVKLQHLRSCIKSLSSVHEERKKRLVIAVLDLIAHWLRVKDVTLVHDVWDSLPLHEQTFDRVLRVCLQCDLTAVRTAWQHPSRRTHIGSSDEEEDAGGEGERSIRFTSLRQRYMIVPDPKRRFPYPKGKDPGHEWMKAICRMLGAMYGFKAQYVHKLWTDIGGDLCEVERQLEGRKTGWLDLRGLGLGDVPRPWVELIKGPM